MSGQPLKRHRNLSKGELLHFLVVLLGLGGTLYLLSS